MLTYIFLRLKNNYQAKTNSIFTSQIYSFLNSMNISLICIGKTTERHVLEGMKLYVDRMKYYAKFSLMEVEAGKGDESQLKIKESNSLLKKVEDRAVLILLDERGKQFTSVEFSKQIAHYQNASAKQLVFAIGGAYGFSNEVYERANLKMALSLMTFPHQLVRVLFLEQLYRAHTILKGEKYHHT
jgi:23S rRNA (pseudouridine1915-N3)-methyltransferase